MMVGNQELQESILEFDNSGTSDILLHIKSGPNWGNSRQIAKMKLTFKTAKKSTYEQVILNLILLQ